jgi:hypothetical protein
MRGFVTECERRRRGAKAPVTGLGRIVARRTERVIERGAAGADACFVIWIEVGGAVEGFDLRESLARRGIQAELVEAVGGWEVRVTSTREEPDRLLRDVTEAVEAWRAGDLGGIVARLKAGPISAEEGPKAPVTI